MKSEAEVMPGLTRSPEFPVRVIGKLTGGFLFAVYILVALVLGALVVPFEGTIDLFAKVPERMRERKRRKRLRSESTGV
ncbi:MAG: hypothetical protein HGB18_00090 [Candidatus Moranbacteria bacterium]|nr:hypothetical protein [Candidatus Moranbacteria bacterium]